MENISASPTSSNSFITPLLISMIGIVITFIAILSYHFILVRYCLRRRLQQQQEITNTTSSSRSNPNSSVPSGIDKRVLEKIPIKPYSEVKSDLLFRVDQSECVVCLGELEEGDMVRLLPICRHAFHVPCIDQWFLGHTSCPLCRCCPMISSTNNYVVLPMPTSIDNERSRNESNDCDIIGSSSSGVQSVTKLRHCLSAGLAIEKRSSSWRLSITHTIDRTMSIDQSFIEELKRARPTECSSSSLYFTRSKSGKAWSLRTIDLPRVSSKLIRSSSQIRGDKGSGILPY